MVGDKWLFRGGNSLQADEGRGSSLMTFAMLGEQHWHFSMHEITWFRRGLSKIPDNRRSSKLQT